MSIEDRILKILESMNEKNAKDVVDKIHNILIWDGSHIPKDYIKDIVNETKNSNK